MMQVPSSIRQFRIAARSVKNEVGDMVDILSRQEEEALHIAYDKGYVNRIKTIVGYDIAETNDTDTVHDTAVHAEDLTLPREDNTGTREVANIKLLRAEEDSTTWIKWGPEPARNARGKAKRKVPGRRQKRPRTPTYIGMRRCEWKMISSPRLNQAKKARKLHISTCTEPAPDMGEQGWPGSPCAQSTTREKRDPLHPTV